MAQNKSDNLQVNAPKQVDNKRGIFSGGTWRAYNNKQEVYDTLPVGARYPTQEVDVLLGGVPITYWFRDGTAEVNLIVKNPDIIGKVPIISNKSYPSAFDGTVYVVTLPQLSSSGKQIDFICRSGNGGLYTVDVIANDSQKTVTYNPSNGQIGFEQPFYDNEFVWAQFRNS